MQIDSFKIKKYINHVGFYGMIEIETNVIEKSASLVIEFDKIHVEQEWHLTIEFGIRYFFEHFAKTTNNGLSVSVKKLHTMLGDSSHIVVFFITAKCLCAALKYQNKIIDFDETTGIFLINK